MVKTRLDLFTSLPQGAQVAEIGVMAGDFLKQIHVARPDLYYTGVDSWQGAFEKYYPYVQAYCAATHHARIMRMTSLEASRWMQGQTFDLIYIDAYHTYESVMTDIRAWAPLVKKGGILAGHDYESKPANEQWEAIEVKLAVDDWAKDKHKVNVIQESCPTWWVKL